MGVSEAFYQGHGGDVTGKRMDIRLENSSEINPDDIMPEFDGKKYGFTEVMRLSSQELKLASETSAHAMMIRRYIRELSCVFGIDEDILLLYFIKECENSPYSIEVVYRAICRELMESGELSGLIEGK